MLLRTKIKAKEKEDAGMTFGEKLLFLRKQSGLSQEQIAEKLNVSRQAVSRWEAGAIPDMENMVKISGFFDCSLDYLMNDSIEKLPEKVTEAPHYDVVERRRIQPETVCLMVGLAALAVVLIFWIVSKFVDVGIHHQDAVSKMWYTGFGGFADYYGLHPLLLGCAAIWMIAAACRMYIQLFVRRYIVNKKYLLCRICSLLLYAVGTVIWIICVLKPWKFMWTIGISITVVIYGLVIAASLASAKYFEGR